MAIKTYFDVTWQGPVLDAQNNPTKEIKGTKPPLVVTRYGPFAFLPPPSPPPPLPWLNLEPIAGSTIDLLLT